MYSSKGREFFKGFFNLGAQENLLWSGQHDTRLLDFDFWMFKFEHLHAQVGFLKTAREVYLFLHFISRVNAFIIFFICEILLIRFRF